MAPRAHGNDPASTNDRGPSMKLVSLIAAGALVLATAPAANAASLCEQLSQAIDLAKTGFGPIEGDPLSADPDNHYWHSTIQLSAGDNCSVEAHKVLTCSWQPSTADDLKKMTNSVAACFHKAKRIAVPSDDPKGPPGASFKFDAASIEIGLTANILSLNVEPLDLAPPPDAPSDLAPVDTAPNPNVLPPPPEAGPATP